MQKSQQRQVLVLGLIASFVLTPSSSFAFGPFTGKSKPVPAAPSAPADNDKVQVIISVTVPFNIDAQDDVVIAPFPLPAPKFDIPNDLPTSNAEVRDMIKKMLSYRLGNPNQSRPDWRIDRVFKEALNLSGKHVPSGELGLDTWIDEFLPYMKSEIRAMNNCEKTRRQHYDEMAKVPNAFRTYMQQVATSKNYSPVGVPIQQIRKGLIEGRTSVGRGVWWIVGKRTVGGLTYYWQQQVNLQDGPRYFDLTEYNALAIQGNV